MSVYRLQSWWTQDLIDLLNKRKITVTDYASRQHLLRPIRTVARVVPDTRSSYDAIWCNGMPADALPSQFIPNLATVGGQKQSYYRIPSTRSNGCSFIFAWALCASLSFWHTSSEVYEIELTPKWCWQETGSRCKSAFDREAFLQRSLLSVEAISILFVTWF